jgi:general secretion pathway protein H
MQQGQAVAFTIDLTARQYGPEGAAPQKIPSSVAIQTTVGTRDGQGADTQARIVFLPDGGSSGGVVDVQRPTGQGTRIRVDWLMGQIIQEPRTP